MFLLCCEHDFHEMILSSLPPLWSLPPRSPISFSIASLPLALTARERGQVIPTCSFNFSHKWDNIVVECRRMLNSPLETYCCLYFSISLCLFYVGSLSDLKRDLSFFHYECIFNQVLLPSYQILLYIISTFFDWCIHTVHFFHTLYLLSWYNFPSYLV